MAENDSVDGKVSSHMPYPSVNTKRVTFSVDSSRQWQPYGYDVNFVRIEDYMVSAVNANSNIIIVY